MEQTRTHRREASSWKNADSTVLVAKKCCRVAHFEEEEEEISFPVEIFKRVLLIYLVGFKNTGFYRHAYYEGSTAGILVAGYIYVSKFD